jgi:hypothetical protein
VAPIGPHLPVITTALMHKTNSRTTLPKHTSNPGHMYTNPARYRAPHKALAPTAVTRGRHQEKPEIHAH